MSTAFLFNNKMMKYGTHAMGISSSPTPPVPVIPANTVRVRTSDGNVPVKGSSATYESATLVEGTSDVYDVYKSGTSFRHLLYQSSNIVEVIGANFTGITKADYMLSDCTALTAVNNILNTSNVTDMAGMFDDCTSLTTVPLFNTSSVTDMSSMFSGCRALTSVPLFDTSSATTMADMFYDCQSLTYVPLFNTSNATNMNYMFYRCLSVESGALALYQQASTQATPPSKHNYTFEKCGSNTETGAAELAQIPKGWK